MTPGLANRSFRLGQLVTGTWVAFTHGANDAQKTMGVIALALYAHGTIDTFYIPTWVKSRPASSIAAGTYTGGWRIMRTLGQRVFQMDPPAGFAAQATAGAVIFASTHVRLSALDDPRRLRRGDGRRRDEAPLGGPLGRRREHRVRVGADHPGGGGGCRARSGSRSR